MKFFSSLMACLLLAIPALAAESVVGLYKTIDDESGEAKSLVQIYTHEGKVYGRVVKLFKDVDKKAVGVKGDPKIVGLDVVWGLQDEGERFEGGKILDPAKGKIYGCEMWRDGDKLIVRGKIGPFGRNQTWIYEGAGKSDKLVPSIPVKK